MAHEHGPTDDHSAGGSMDITDHVKMWLAFWKGAQWSVGTLIVIALLLFFFRTHNG
jgi:hypothetical protein